MTFFLRERKFSEKKKSRVKIFLKCCKLDYVEKIDSQNFHAHMESENAADTISF